MPVLARGREEMREGWPSRAHPVLGGGGCLGGVGVWLNGRWLGRRSGQPRRCPRERTESWRLFSRPLRPVMACAAIHRRRGRWIASPSARNDDDGAVAGRGVGRSGGAGGGPRVAHGGERAAGGSEAVRIDPPLAEPFGDLGGVGVFNGAIDDEGCLGPLPSALSPSPSASCASAAFHSALPSPRRSPISRAITRCCS